MVNLPGFAWAGWIRLPSLLLFERSPISASCPSLEILYFPGNFFIGSVFGLSEAIGWEA